AAMEPWTLRFHSSPAIPALELRAFSTDPAPGTIDHRSRRLTMPVASVTRYARPAPLPADERLNQRTTAAASKTRRPSAARAGRRGTDRPHPCACWYQCVGGADAIFNLNNS